MHFIKELSIHDLTVPFLYREVIEDRGREFLGYCEDYEYRFLICRGCDTATLEEKWTCSGMNDNDGNDIYTYEHSPKRKNLGVREAKRFVHIDKKLNETYKEIIIAHQQGLGIVTPMGIRALLEGICVIEGVDDKQAWSLGKKIEFLKDSANIPDSIIDGLKGIKFIGDDAAHRLNATDKNSIRLSIDLLEALLTHLYEAKFDLQQKADLVKKAHNRDRDAPREAPLPHHRTYGSVSGGSAGQNRHRQNTSGLPGFTQAERYRHFSIRCNISVRTCSLITTTIYPSHSAKAPFGPSSG